jgi:hypothetical protein
MDPGNRPGANQKGQKPMNMMKRGLIALAVTAAVGGTAGGLLASAASASPTRGPEVLHVTSYSVGAGEGSGPWSGHGAVNTRGNITDDVASLPTDPANSSRHLLVDPTGSFTVLATGGTNPTPKVNMTTCFVIFTVRNVNVKIVSGTGAYANATGRFNATVVNTGYLNRTATGACNTAENIAPAFSTTYVTAKGRINLHTHAT